VFGGLYAPHLRTALWKNLIRAEWLADRQVPGGLLSRVEMLDYDADGVNELLFTSLDCQALLKPSDGATLAAVDFRPADSTLINSMQRRQEAYHARLVDAPHVPIGVVASIHEQTRMKEQGLEKYLRYDRWARNAFRVLIFSPKRTHGDYELLQLQEDAGFAAGDYAMISSGPQEVEIAREAMLPTKDGDVLFSLTKRFSFGPAPNGCEVACEIGIKLKQPMDRAVMIGIKSVINLLAPNDADRFFETAEGPRPLRFSGILPGPILRMEDGWQRVRITLHAPGTEDYWIAPIETVSESEGGFERVYQGSQILTRWKLSTEKVFSARLVWRIESF
jgi:alpha-amylase